MITENTGYDYTGTQKAIADFEKTYPTLAEAFKETQKEQYELFASKMMDYGLSNIALGSSLEESEDITAADIASPLVRWIFVFRFHHQRPHVGDGAVRLGLLGFETNAFPE